MSKKTTRLIEANINQDNTRQKIGEGQRAGHSGQQKGTQPTPINGHSQKRQEKQQKEKAKSKNHPKMTTTARSDGSHHQWVPFWPHHNRTKTQTNGPANAHNKKHAEAPPIGRSDSCHYMMDGPCQCQKTTQSATHQPR